MQDWHQQESIEAMRARSRKLLPVLGFAAAMMTGAATPGWLA